MNTQLIELIRTETHAGTADDSMPFHMHTQLWTTDGTLVVELCQLNECDTLEPPEGF